MTYYIQEVNRIKEICFSNKFQIEVAVNARKYINQNFEKPIDLDLLAELNYISKYHLIRVFRKYLGITPRQYLINRRIAEAKKLLKTGLSVSETCYAIGYESVGSFSNLFTAKTGLSPTLFQMGNFR